MATAQGIQTLLEAEKDASQIVTKARQYRIQRLKDARTEAAKDIEALKAAKNADFVAFESQYAGSSDSAVQKVDADTAVRLKENDATYSKHKPVVLEKLLKAIVAVEPKVHENIKYEQ
ncbi:MAG: hypothetical protein SGCHY_003211 [Lobulomycetales sp.]